MNRSEIDRELRIKPLLAVGRGVLRDSSFERLAVQHPNGSDAAKPRRRAVVVPRRDVMGHRSGDRRDLRSWDGGRSWRCRRGLGWSRSRSRSRSRRNGTTGSWLGWRFGERSRCSSRQHGSSRHGHGGYLVGEPCRDPGREAVLAAHPVLHHQEAHLDELAHKLVARANARRRVHARKRAEEHRTFVSVEPNPDVHDVVVDAHFLAPQAASATRASAWATPSPINCRPSTLLKTECLGT